MPWSCNSSWTTKLQNTLIGRLLRRHRGVGDCQEVTVKCAYARVKSGLLDLAQSDLQTHNLEWSHPVVYMIYTV
jgi:hypothetical protein